MNTDSPSPSDSEAPRSLHGAALQSAQRGTVTEASLIATTLAGIAAWAQSTDLDSNTRELAKEELRAWSNLALHRLPELRNLIASNQGAGAELFHCHSPKPVTPPSDPTLPSDPTPVNYVPGPNAPGSSVPEGGTLPGSPGQTSPGTPGSLPPGSPGQTDPTAAAAKREYGAPSA